jgi:DNA-binding GntR family transcriptional regulator
MVQTEATSGPARDAIAGQLRDWIVTGVLAPGEIIRDTEVAQAFAVSRTPVREALLQLRGEGLVEMKPQGWTQVKPVDLRQVADLLRVVIELEALAARLAAERPDRDLRAAEAANDELRGLVERATPELAWNIVDANDRFHQTIVGLSGNEFLASALLPLKTQMRRYERIVFSQATTIGRDSVEQHDQILAAIRAGNADSAAALVSNNFDNAPVRQFPGPDRRQTAEEPA